MNMLKVLSGGCPPETGNPGVSAGQCKMTACWLGVESEYEALILSSWWIAIEIPCCRLRAPLSSAPKTCTIGL
jgi:hypothetical protein